jgi:carbon monoxide dehydrogenase subunit G
MSEVTMSIDIKAPPEDVWAVVMDPHRFGEWVTIHRKLHEHDHGPPFAGMKMRQSMAIRGATFKVKWELAECQVPTLAHWKGRGPARSHAETEYRLTAIDGGTRFDYRNSFAAPMGPLGAAASKVLVGGVPEREARASLAALKRLLERTGQV